MPLIPPVDPDSSDLDHDLEAGLTRDAAPSPQANQTPWAPPSLEGLTGIQPAQTPPTSPGGKSPALMDRATQWSPSLVRDSDSILDSYHTEAGSPSPLPASRVDIEACSPPVPTTLLGSIAAFPPPVQCSIVSVPTDCEPTISDPLQAESAADAEPPPYEGVNELESNGRETSEGAGVREGSSSLASYGKNAPGPGVDSPGPPIAVQDDEPMRWGFGSRVSTSWDGPGSAGAERAETHDGGVPEGIRGGEVSPFTHRGASKFHKRMHLTDSLPQGIGPFPVSTVPSACLSFCGSIIEESHVHLAE